MCGLVSFLKSGMFSDIISSDSKLLSFPCSGTIGGVFVLWDLILVCPSALSSLAIES